MARPDLPARWFSIGTTIAIAPTLLWRRSHPLWMVVIGFGVCGLAQIPVGGNLNLYSLIFVVLLPYTLYRWGAGREIGLGSAVIAAKILLSWPPGWLSSGQLVEGFVVLSLVAALGAAFRYRARVRLRELERVKLLERERLARDLHDTVAHHVSAMAIRAQAGLATLDSRPDAAADALRVIEAEASRTLAEMRTIVRALRDDEAADRAPAPRISDLPRLADVDDRVDVLLAGDVDNLPAPVDAAVFRLAQESVTNARRHARQATVIRVRVAADEQAVRLEVTDDGAPHASVGSGYGLAGMAERAALLGGSCEAGPAPGRGWTVTAVVPLRA
jgi:nitrate/nitrite-specific signal transduction histidine kinase